MPETEKDKSTEFACASESQRTLRDLRTRRLGQPVYVVGNSGDRYGQEAIFQHFNLRLAIVKFPDGKTLGYDPIDLLLPCEFHDGEPYFEIRKCKTCLQPFPLTSDEFWTEPERAECPECLP